MSKPTRDLRFEAMLVKLMAFCKANNVTAHTSIRGPALVFNRKIVSPTRT